MVTWASSPLPNTTSPITPHTSGARALSKVAFLFPGQGAQTVGMGQQLAAEVPAAKALMDQACEILGYDLAKICYEGPQEELNATVHSQPALFVTSLMAVEALRAKSPEVVDSAAVAAGLSLGEYTALVFAGAMTFEDGLRLVQVRATGMQAAADAVESGMVSILGLEREQVESLVDQARGEDVLQVANLLGPGNIAVSGHLSACARVTEAAEAAGAMKVVPLAVAGAFHTPLMQPAVEKLAAAVAEVPMAEARIPVVMNVDGSEHTSADEIRELLVLQVVSPVLWEATQRHLLSGDYEQFYELGAGRVLRGLLRRIERKVNCENVSA
ncbi:MAG: [acyl-carrier-protein] S-malonyltransferase [Planctomycetota bacterium]|nr:MAG: [acyl-carrier-protein] S-malonyltransferase [Planctomycetota bacterium]REK39402.1 MAG: [acyl-carrier-protein] S-malonyltransferase [Planctomycetota bacterium]